MKKRYIAITSFSIGFGVTCLVWGLIWLVMAKDLSNKVKVLEEEKRVLNEERIYLEWALEQTDQMICNFVEE